MTAKDEENVALVAEAMKTYREHRARITSGPWVACCGICGRIPLLAKALEDAVLGEVGGSMLIPRDVADKIPGMLERGEIGPVRICTAQTREEVEAHRAKLDAEDVAR